MKLNRNSLIIILTSILVVFIISTSFYIVNMNKESNFNFNFNSNDSSDSNSNYNLNSSSNDLELINQISNVSLPSGPTNKAKINTCGINSRLLGNDEMGTVEVLGPFGNIKSNIKIAYLTGMHPYESKVHKALFDSIKAKNSSLKYCYYVYKTNVSSVGDEDHEGRNFGQLLAQKYVKPDVILNNFTFVVDVHSNKGLVGGSYEKTNFVFAPGNDRKSLKLANKLISEIGGICSYVPKDQTSPPFITIPIEKAGIPTVIYESYSYEHYNKTVSLIFDLINAIDNLNF